MGDLRPNLGDIRFRYEMLSNVGVMMLPYPAFHALLSMVSYVASAMVWTYTEPSNGALPDDDKRLWRLANVTPATWKRVRPHVEPFFMIRGGRWLLKEPWIEISTASGARIAIPAQIKESVRQREGERCTYCGATDRPLEFDHIYPVSRGGTNDPSNLTLACDQCNRSKGASTLEEWMRG